MTNPVKDEQNLIADHICARLDAGVDIEVMAAALNGMMMEIAESGEGKEAQEVTH